MTTVEPVGPAELFVPAPIRASALAAWQLVEDARYRTPERSRRNERRRLLAQRAVADRKAEREHRTS